MTWQPDDELVERCAVGDTSDPFRAGDELVIFAIAGRDALVLAALIEAGAAALKYAPCAASNVTELVSRRSAYRLGARAARALRAEAARVNRRLEDRYAAAEKRSSAK